MFVGPGDVRWVTEMSDIYLFTWNVGGKKNKKKASEAHDLCQGHLAKKGKEGPFIACLQELPSGSLIDSARKNQPDAQKELQKLGINVVVAKQPPDSLALVYGSDLKPITEPECDPDKEYAAIVFEHIPSQTTIGVVGVHAKSPVDMQKPEDIGASRALLRQAINALEFMKKKSDVNQRKLILGDFNSHCDNHEIQSWHCFYALTTNRPVKGDSYLHRRNLYHEPLYIIQPSLHDMKGTFVFKDSSSNGSSKVVDFFVVDEQTRFGATSTILSVVNAESVWNEEEFLPCLSDHLPAEGRIQI